MEDANDRIAQLNRRITAKDEDLNTKKESVRDKNAYIAELRERLQQMKKPSSPAAPPKLVAPEPASPPKGDTIHRMMTNYMRLAGVEVPLKRLGGGYYLFGTRKIFAKIMNDKLVVRVGGGYMTIEEFI